MALPGRDLGSCRFRWARSKVASEIMGGVNTGIVSIHAEWRNQQSPIDADRVHRCHDVVAGDLIRTLQESNPRALRTIPIVAKYL